MFPGRGAFSLQSQSNVSLWRQEQGLIVSRDGWLEPAMFTWGFLLSQGPVLPSSEYPRLPLMVSVGGGGPHRRVLDALQDQTLVIESAKTVVQENCFLSNFTLLKSERLSTAC